jgi:hypothetical protein
MRFTAKGISAQFVTGVMFPALFLMLARVMTLQSYTVVFFTRRCI